MSLTNRRLNYFKKDERKAVQEYEEAAEMAVSEASKKLFKSMAEDEERHFMMLDVIENHEKEPKKSLFGRFRKKSDEEKIKESFEKQGVYREQGAEDEVSVDRPELPEKNEWNEEYEDDEE